MDEGVTQKYQSYGSYRRLIRSLLPIRNHSSKNGEALGPQASGGFRKQPISSLTATERPINPNSPSLLFSTPSLPFSTTLCHHLLSEPKLGMHQPQRVVKSSHKEPEKKPPCLPSPPPLNAEKRNKQKTDSNALLTNPYAASPPAPSKKRIHTDVI